MSERYTHEEVVLAALLHDMGKMVQRLRGQPAGKETDPLYKYRHAELTHQFLQDDLRITGCPGIDWGHVARLAGRHHAPDAADPVQLLMQQADRASASFDRSNDDDATRMNVHLQAFFSTEEKRVGMRDLCFEAGGDFPLFPGGSDEESFSDALSNHAQRLSEMLSNATNARLVIDAVIWFLRRFLYCTPCDMKHAPRISLYDHAMSTAAVASALFRSTGGRGPADKAALAVICGGADGIQRFIAGSSGTKAAASGLRGRSLFIQLFTEQVRRHLLERLELFDASVIMDAGGRFWILAPGGGQTEKIVDAVRHDVERHLVGRFACSLALNLTLVPATLDDFKKERFRELLERIRGEMVRAEQRPFSTVLADCHVLDVRHEATSDDACDSCRQSLKENGPYCSVCASMIGLGRDARRFRHVIWRRGEAGEGPFLDGAPAPVICDPGNPQGLFSDDCVAAAVRTAVEGKDNRTAECLLPLRTVGRHIPDCSIDEMAKGRYVAALKVDVDNLGDLFREHGSSDLSSCSTFSRAVDFFFSDVVQGLLEREPWSQRVYTVFSGGDDLFVIGDMEIVVDLAFEIRDLFAGYVDNPDIHFSAGITLHHGRYPVRHMIDEADKALASAKASGKDALAFQGDVQPWSKAREWFDLYRRIRDAGWYQRKPGDEAVFSHDFWRRLLTAVRSMKLVEAGHPTINDCLFEAHLKYYVARNLGGVREPKAAAFRDDVMKGDCSAFLKRVYNPVRLAVWAAREKEAR